MTRQKLKLGIVSALAEEQHGLIDVMLNKTQIIRGKRTIQVEACGELMSSVYSPE
ncbi:MAG: hypothetical protein WBJ21_07705 [Burkholderiaceae bacterium]